MENPAFDTIEIKLSDGRVWVACITYRALAKIEELTHRDLKRIAQWKDISSGKDWPVIVWCFLGKHNPTVGVDEVIDSLNPQAQETLANKLFDMMFPEVVAAWNARDKSKDGDGPKPQPAPLVTT